MLTFCGAAAFSVVLGLAIAVISAAVLSECCDHDWVGVPH